MGLGINAPITAQIYKMLIYEKGAMFKPHTENVGTEKIPGPSAGLQRFETQALHGTLNRWLGEAAASQRKCLYHVLDHDYTEANISLKALKARDLAQVHVLKEIFSELPVDIFLALLELEEMGTCEGDPWDTRYAKYDYYDDDIDDEAGYHEIDSVIVTKYAVKTLVDLDGHVVAEGLHLNEDDILEEDCFEGLDAEEEYEGYMGNSVVSLLAALRLGRVFANQISADGRHC
ncbi:hypothetical protein QQS21_007425 [Conoideocrella luteorostrata]|uniref:Uncharacterized protein n=1 Tax=Conoideocrella luteorostrata TaxID=1105319 RepID=A0AAJ0CN65_9HYPO|nr:hypothetical protein QQS21_007425 [Conoideocrella luteorostrata]